MNLFQRLANHISGFFTTTLEPFLEHLGTQVKHDALVALAPFAHTAVQTLLAAGEQLLAGSPPADILKNTLAAVEATGKSAVEAAIQVTGHDLLTAVAGAIATAQAAATTQPATAAAP